MLVFHRKLRSKNCTPLAQRTSTKKLALVELLKGSLMKAAVQPILKKSIAAGASEEELEGIRAFGTAWEEIIGEDIETDIERIATRQE
jgi:hypothetical protein